ncbi:hypothetical protein K8I61_07065 [bacterium]|nr:hypothetical protein [bacterium]
MFPLIMTARQAPAKKTLPPEAIRVTPRTFHCPVCQSRELRGESVEPPATALAWDDSLAATIADPFYLVLDLSRINTQFSAPNAERLSTRDLAPFDMFLCSRDLFVTAGADRAGDGAILPEHQAWYAERAGKSPAASPTLTEMFYHVVLHHLRGFFAVDWLAHGKARMMLSYDGWLKYAKKPQDLTLLLKEHIRAFGQGSQGGAFTDSSRRVAEVFEGGFPALVSRYSFANPAAREILLQYRLLEATHRLAALAGSPAPALRLKESIGHHVYRHLDGVRRAGSKADRATLSDIIDTALRLRQTAPNGLRRARLDAILFVATEARLAGEPWDYGQALFDPKRLATNNEAVMYLNLTARARLAIGDHRAATPAAEMRARLADAMNAMPLYAAAEGTPANGFSAGLATATRRLIARSAAA